MAHWRLALTLDFIVRHGYAVLFLWVLAEQAALPLPSVPLLLACGALAHNGRLSFHVAILAALVPCILADNAWYLVGRRQGSRILHFICRISLEPDSCVRRTETVFFRYGSRALLVAKFVPGLNAVAAPLAALSGVRHAHFVIFDTLGALVWLVAYLGLGYLFSDQLDLAVDYLERMGSGLGVLVVALLAGWIAWKFIQRRRFLRKLTVARITPEELRRMLDAGDPVFVVDVRQAIESDDAIPGSLHIPLEDLDARYGDIPRDRDIVLFCS